MFRSLHLLRCRTFSAQCRLLSSPAAALPTKTVADAENDDEFVTMLASRAGMKKSKKWPVLHELQLYRERREEAPAMKVYESAFHLFAETRQSEDALQLLESMKQSDIKPSMKAYSCIIRCLARDSRLSDSYRIWSELEHEGYESTSYIFSALIIGEGVSGSAENVMGLLNRAKENFESVQKPIYTAALSAFRSLDNGDRAIQVLDMMYESQQLPDALDYAIVISCQSSLEAIIKLMDRMNENGIDVTQQTYRYGFIALSRISTDPWISLVELFELMNKNGIVPDEKTWEEFILSAEKCGAPIPSLNKYVIKMKKSGFKPPRRLLARARGRPMYTKPVKPDFEQPPPRKPFVRVQPTIIKGRVWTSHEDYSLLPNAELPKSLLSKFMKLEDDEEQSK